MKKLFFPVLILVLLFSCTIFNTTPSNYVYAGDIPIETRTSDESEKPAAEAIFEIKRTPAMELWHYSGGYWKYDDYVITDEQLKGNLENEDELSLALNKEVEFEVKIENAEYEELAKRDKLIVYISPTTPGIKLSDLFDGKPSVEIKNNMVIFKAKPKFHFSSRMDREVHDSFDGQIDVVVPIVDPDYGYNRYSIWGKSTGVGWGAAEGFFDKNNPDIPAPSGSGMIAPNQIINDQGYLKNGFTVKTIKEGINSTYTSSESSVGYGTFKYGGAVAIHFDFPITLSFYAEEMEDLSAQFDSLPSSAVAGDEVQVSIRVKSNFEEPVKDVPYTWNIKTKGDSIIPATFSGHIGNSRQGTIAEIPARGERVLVASFTMPNEDIHIDFEMNKEGKTPEETYLDNNVLDSGKAIRVVSFETSTGEFELPYNVLSRKVKYSLANSPIVAQLILPIGNWIGPATGALQISNQTPNVLRDFRFTENPDVNEYSDTITRSPQIHATLKRPDFGDDPQGRDWLNLANPSNPENRNGIAAYQGMVNRPFEFVVIGPCSKFGCSSTIVKSSTSAAFPSGNNTKTISIYIYNGMENVPKKTYKEEIDNNSETSTAKQMFWKNEPYDYNVIRWMYHLDENATPYDYTPVGGQYERIFTQQASADLAWSVNRSMDQEYKTARETAKKMKNQKSAFDKAVFATDRELQKFDYPIKSGYYFNPTGTYSFDVETVLYKPTTADTDDHKDLVQALIDSFRYESDLMYINSDRQAVNIRGELLPKKGAGYERKPGILSAAHNTGVNDAKLLDVLDKEDNESRYVKKVEEIYHSQDPEGDTHDYWKMVLEGYDDSKTSSSYDQYRYREYVKDGQHMYRITEKTRVTIEINPDNINFYTHANMSDGDYSVKVWMANAGLGNGNYAYKALGTLKGISSLDEIKVTVKGSMYDDLNN